MNGISVLTAPGCDRLDGWLALNGDRLALIGLIAVVQPKTMVQVGVWQARDIAAFLNVFPGLVIHGIDCDPKPEAFLVPFRLVQTSTYRCLREVLTATKPELVYIDGDHSYDTVVFDLETSLNCARQTVVVGHDYRNPDVYQAVALIRSRFPERPFREVWTEPLRDFGTVWGSLFVFGPAP